MRGFSHQRDFVHSVQPTVHLDIINTNGVLIPRPVNKTDLHFFDAVFRQIHNIRKFQAAGDRKSTIFPFGKIFRETVSAIFRRDNRIPLLSDSIQTVRKRTVLRADRYRLFSTLSLSLIISKKCKKGYYPKPKKGVI